MARREELQAEFAKLAERVFALDFWRLLDLGMWTEDTLPERDHHIRVMVKRRWNPRSYAETTEVIELVLLLEGLGFGKLKPGALVALYEPVLQRGRKA